MTKISVFGLGKLGASMVAGFASRGFPVIGTDISRRAVEALEEGRAPVEETGLGELIATHRQRIRATTSAEDSVLGTDISFVIVPTPSDSRGAFSLEYARNAFGDIGRALKKKKKYHTVVLTSTVLPGATRHGLLPVLERESGLRCGPDFGLCYNPEFIALGSVIRDFLNPDFYLLGQFDERSGDALEAVHRQVSANHAPVKRMSLENAELAKIAVNSFVTMKISFANLLTHFCEHLPGGDIDVVSDALGMDSRIGRKYLSGGLGFGGPCFPRDNVALDFLGQALGVDSGLLRENDRFNRNLIPPLLEKIRRHLPPGKTVAVLGLAYKPESHVVEESPGVALCQSLADAGYRVIGHDFLATQSAEGLLQYRALLTRELEEAVSSADALVAMLQHPEYAKIGLAKLLQARPGLMLVDPWRLWRNQASSLQKAVYIPGGLGVSSEDLALKLRRLWEPSALPSASDKS